MEKSELIINLAETIAAETLMITEQEKIISIWRLARTRNYEIAKREGIYLEVIQKVQEIVRNRK